MKVFAQPMEFLEPATRLGNRAVDGLADALATINRIPYIFSYELGGAAVSGIAAKQLTPEHPGIAMTFASLGLVCALGTFANDTA